MANYTQIFPAPSYPFVDSKTFNVTQPWYQSLAFLAKVLNNTVTTTGDAATGTWTISINGNAATATFATSAGTVTNGVYTTGSYANPSWITSLAYSKLTGAPTIASGTYSPTFTNVANLDLTPTSTTCQYLRINNVVTVSGKVTVDPTAGAATSTKVGVSLPIASTFTDSGQCAGTADCSTLTTEHAVVLGDIVNHRAQIEWLATQTTAFDLYFTFTYSVV